APRRRSIPWVVLGGIHFNAGIGFLSSSSSSTAYSRAAWRILRRRLVTLGAAGGRSGLTGRPSRTCRSILGSRSPDTGRVWLVAQRRVLRTLSGQLGSSRRAGLKPQRFRGGGRNPAAGRAPGAGEHHRGDGGGRLGVGVPGRRGDAGPLQVDVRAGEGVHVLAGPEHGDRPTGGGVEGFPLAGGRQQVGAEAVGKRRSLERRLPPSAAHLPSDGVGPRRGPDVLPDAPDVEVDGGGTKATP